LSVNEGSKVIRMWTYSLPFNFSITCSITTDGSSGVASPVPLKHSVAGGRTTVVPGVPPARSQVPVH